MLLHPGSIVACRKVLDGKGQLGVVKCEPSESSEAADANCWMDSYQGKHPFNIHPFPECPY